MTELEQIERKIAQEGRERGFDKPPARNGQAKKEEDSEFAPVQPWDEPVNGDDVAIEIISILDRYLVLPEYTSETIALWIMFCYCYDQFDCCPILAITSPEKRCGKTSLLAILNALCQKPLSASNITPAATFRAIEKWHPTLLVDEADTFLKQYDELRGILNSGHTRPTAFVTRAVQRGKNFDVQRFSTWTPKAIALIGKLSDTLEDRSIRVKMRRKKAGEQRERIPYSKLDKMFTDVRRKIARWAKDFTPNFNISIPDKLDDRAADNWYPLLTIANNLGWSDQANEAAVKLSGTPDTQTYRTMLLQDIHEIFSGQWRAKDQPIQEIFTSDLLEKLNSKPEKPWCEFTRGNPMSARKLAYMLQPFDISSSNISIDGKRLKGFTKKDFDDAFDRYL